jgi:hypothetical protein
MATALRTPEGPPAPLAPPTRAPLLGLLGAFILFAVAIAVIGGLVGQPPRGSCAASAPVPLPAPGTGGSVLSGAVSWFGGPHDPSSGPTTADGKPVSDPGIAVYDTATLNGYWSVRFPNGRTAVFQQTDIGPAPWTGRVLDVLYSALPYVGYTEASFPTGAQITATYLGTGSHAAALAVTAGSPSPAAECATAAGRGDGSLASVIAAADLLESMHVPYNYGGGHVTPARPTAGQEGSYLGLDCSSAVSFVLQHAGVNVETMDSTGFMTWGEPGPGQSVTLYANPGHVFMIIAGRAFGTSGFGHPAAGTGPAWFTVKPEPAYLALFVARHPPGL